MGKIKTGSEETVRCSSCGSACPADENFCHHCGEWIRGCPNFMPVKKPDGSHKLSDKGYPVYERCGYEGNKEGERRCDECGGELRNVPWDCSYCKTKEISPMRRRCPNCSEFRPDTKIIINADGIPWKVAKARMEHGLKYCYRCGGETLESSSFYTYCKFCDDESYQAAKRRLRRGI
jgi:hypothetical protein